MSEKMIEVKYGGAPTGSYRIKVTSEQYGLLGNGKNKFDSVFEFTDFQPRTGSVYGGQLITITGKHFATNAFDTPVKVGYEYIDRAIQYCDFISSTDTEIKCRMRLDPSRQVGEYDLIVFSNEEAACTADECKLTFIGEADLPTVEKKELSWDSAAGVLILTVTGSGITDVDTSTV